MFFGASLYLPSLCLLKQPPAARRLDVTRAAGRHTPQTKEPKPTPGTYLTTGQRKVGTRPELLGVLAHGSAHVAVQLDPVRLVWRARAGPRRRVELLVSDVLARVAGV